MTELPGSPPQKLRAIWGEISDTARKALLAHVEGGTSAERLALVLTEEGHRISATTLKLYLRALRGEGV